MSNSIKVLSAKFLLKGLENIFGPNKKLLRQAELLVSSANLHAISSYTPTADQFKELRKKVSGGDWDYIITVAGVYIAIYRLGGLKVNHIAKDKILTIVLKQLEVWNANGSNDIEDCDTNFHKEYDRLILTDAYKNNSGFLSADVLGSWIFYKLFQTKPQTIEDYNLSRSAGSMVIHNFFQWWNV
jgi:hypothetical protein